MNYFTRFWLSHHRLFPGKSPVVSVSVSVWFRTTLECEINRKVITASDVRPIPNESETHRASLLMHILLLCIYYSIPFGIVECIAFKISDRISALQRCRVPSRWPARSGTSQRCSRWYWLPGRRDSVRFTRDCCPR